MHRLTKSILIPFGALLYIDVPRVNIRHLWQKALFFNRYINSCICVTKSKVCKKINNIDSNGKDINYLDFIRYYTYTIKTTIVRVSYSKRVVM